MLMAAAVGDRRRFHTIWRWTRIHLQQPDGLFAYHWADGHVVNTTPATDADLETARALLLAGRRFHDAHYTASARRVAEAILTHETAQAGPLTVLIAGPWANKGSYLVIDPSYIDPVALRQLGQLTGNPRFRALATSGETLVNELMFSATDPIDIVTEHSLSGAVIGSDHNPVTVIAAAAAAVAAGDAAAVPGLLAAASRLNSEHPTYFGSAWLALGRLLLSTNRSVGFGAVRIVWMIPAGGSDGSRAEPGGSVVRARAGPVATTTTWADLQTRRSRRAWRSIRSSATRASKRPPAMSRRRSAQPSRPSRIVVSGSDWGTVSAAALSSRPARSWGSSSAGR
jgi:hypothetical protein